MNFVLLTPKLGERGQLERKRRNMKSARERIKIPNNSGGLWVAGAPMKPNVNYCDEEREVNSRRRTSSRPQSCLVNRPSTSHRLLQPQKQQPTVDAYQTICLTSLIKHFPSDSLHLPDTYPQYGLSGKALQVTPRIQTKMTNVSKQSNGTTGINKNNVTSSQPIPIRSSKTPRRAQSAVSRSVPRQSAPGSLSNSINGTHNNQRPRFSPYVNTRSITISSARKQRNATISGDDRLVSHESPDIDDPHIYPTTSSKYHPMSQSYDGTFFMDYGGSSTARRRKDFIIHPEWISEAVSVERLHLNDRPLIQPVPKCVTDHQRPKDWPRRCKSVPPTTGPPTTKTYNNPITWQ